MRLLANENFPLDSVLYLRSRGVDIASIGLDFAGITDEEVLNIAVEQKRTIITFDRDYGTLIFKQNFKPENGIIFLRLAKFESEEPGKIIEYIIALDNFSPDRALTVFDGAILRQKKY